VPHPSAQAKAAGRHAMAVKDVKDAFHERLENNNNEDDLNDTEPQ
jgi:hypothetical protein